MGQRIRTAIVAIPIALCLIKLGGLPFALGVLLLGLVGFREFQDMLTKDGIQVYRAMGMAGTCLLILAAGAGHGDWLLPLVTLFSLLVMLEGLYCYAQGHFPENTGLTCMALVYLGLPFAHFILLRELTGPVQTLPLWGPMSLGEALLWTVMFATWASDTFAYFGGRAFGRTKLLPRVSPKKTREGALCGFIGCVLTVWLLGNVWLGYPLLPVLLLGIGIGIFAPLGDLVESILKRSCDIKDSGNFFPGHGGVLDRCDSLIFSVPFAYYFITLFLLP
ncbi:MAG: phosphatidate cytidylyltransferase [Acidaminococcus sp.]|uniref:phosphatidate cytidylyltransferase n=1 Tax=Acidaminococcus sp. TaxID=1872103 RepID=UPI0026DF2C1D|nr:phosphatidate cytidylyltransferase [Acidaminococcus sp.]MDO5597055.1 phosphatidate cytidylyltransferase [Acidaminococcus sp.]